MERRAFGKTGLQLSVLGFGGAEIGAQATTQDEVNRLLGTALDAGLNVVDTAECYGESEERIGRAIGSRRQDFHLFTKCGHEGDALNGKDWDPETLMRSIERSLKRLRTDHVDLVQLHSCGKELLESGEVTEVLQRAKRDGKTRFIGYSGDNDAAIFAAESGAFDALQTSVSIADQVALSHAIPLAVKAQMGVIAKRPIANAAWKRGDEEDFYGKEYRDRLKELGYAFLKGSDDVATALRFTLAVPGVTTMIVGTRHPDRWPANARLVGSGALSRNEYDAIRERWTEVSAGKDWAGLT